MPRGTRLRRRKQPAATLVQAATNRNIPPANR